MSTLKAVPREAYVVYEIRCVPTGKVYIGSTNNHYRRWSYHRWQLNRGEHHCLRLQRAWRKYGEAAFTTSILAIALTAGGLLQLEQQVLDQTGAAKSALGFNAAEHTNRPVFNEEIRAKMIAASRLRERSTWRKSEAAKRSISAAKKGKSFSEAHKRNMSLARLGVATKVTEEMRVQIIELKAQGLSNRAIGRAVGVCNHTIKSVLPNATNWKYSSEGSAWLSAHAKRVWSGRTTVDAVCHCCGDSFATYYPSRARWCSTRCRNKAVKQKQLAITAQSLEVIH